MLIDWMKYEKKDHVLSWVILEAMSEIGIKKFGEFDSSKLNVEFKVNGIEVPFESIMNLLDSQLDSIKEESINEGKQQMIDNVQKLLMDIDG